MKTYLILLSLLMITMSCRADLRPDSLADQTQPEASEEKKGRAILAKAVSAHGGERFKSVKTYDLTFTDSWKGLLGMLGNPWPESDIEAKVAYRKDSFDARVQFYHEEDKGLLWGIQSWKSYTIEPGQTKPVFEDDSDILFVLPAIQYLTEVLFRNHDHNVVTYGGRETINGKAYDTVFMTWKSLEVSSDVDQYIFYIDPETSRVAKLQYTVREFMDFAKGTIHYEDLREVDGVLFSFKQYVTSAVDDDLDDYLHVITLKKVELDNTPVEAFMVDKKLENVGDRKL